MIVPRGIAGDPESADGGPRDPRRSRISGCLPHVRARRARRPGQPGPPAPTAAARSSGLAQGTKPKSRPVRRRNSSWAARRTTGSASSRRPISAGTPCTFSRLSPCANRTGADHGRGVLHLREVARDHPAAPARSHRNDDQRNRRTPANPHDAPSLARRDMGPPSSRSARGSPTSGIRPNFSRRRQQGQSQSGKAENARHSSDDQADIPLEVSAR